MKTITGTAGPTRTRSVPPRVWVTVALTLTMLATSLQLGNGAAAAQTAPSSASPPSSPGSFPPVDSAAGKNGKKPPSVTIPSPDPAVVGRPPALPQVKAGQELVDRRTANSKTFAGDQPGQLRTEFHDGPVHFQDAQGRWADIDDTLVVSKDGRRHNKSNAFDLSVAATSTDGAVARLAVDDKRSVGFSLDGAAKVTAKTDSKSVTYPKVRKDTDVRLTSRPTGVKEDLVLASRAAPDRFVFPLELKGLSASLNEAGDVIYRDEAGAERARTPHGFMTDANIDPRSDEAPMSLGVTYALIPWGNGTALEVRLDRAWLDDPARVYPVTVDPQLVAWAGNDDTYVMSGFHRDNSYDPELKVGTYDGGSHVGRSYIHFDTAALAGASIQSADLKVAERHSWNCAAGWPGLYRVTQGWDGRTMMDFPGAAFDPNPMPVSSVEGSCPNRTVHYNVAAAANHWAANGPSSGLGVMLATNEGDNNAWKKFASTEAGLPAMLEVWYTPPPPPNRPPYVASGVTPANGSVFGTPTTSVSAVYSDPDGGSGQLAFGVWNYQNQLVWSQWTGSLCSGCRATLNVPAVPDNWYYVMVLGWDGAQYSGGNAAPAWSPQQWFFIDTLAPAASELTPVSGASGIAPTQVSARYSEPYGFTGYMYFWLYTTGGTKIVESWSAITNPGAVATLAIPSLAAGTYNLWAMPWDTRQTGPQIGPNTFTVGTPTTTTTVAPTTTTVVPTTTTAAPTTTTTVAPTTTTTAPPTTTTTVAPSTPGAPRNVDAQPGNGEATVTWTAPSTGQVTHYMVTASSGGYRAAVDGDSRSAVVPGLATGTPYSFTVVAWNSSGASPGSTTRAVTPFSRTGSAPVAAGAFHSLSVLSDGTVWSIGNNDYGQLGDGTTTATAGSGVRAVDLANVGSVAAGDRHSLALDMNGTVWSWGNNAQGQLGDEELAESLTPSPVFARAQSIAAGGRHSLALATDGTVWGWGANESGQLGVGGTANSFEAAAVPNLSNVKAIAANGDHSLALTADGAVWAWGANGRGQLGIGATQNRSAPTRVSALNGAQSIAAGRTHSLAIAGEGAVWAWGANGDGQLGNDGTEDSSVPVQVLNIGGATAIAGGDGFSLAILSDGTTQAWGLNDRYQLGTNDLISTRTPVPVENQGVQGEPTTLFLGATAIAAGTFHGFAATGQGRIYEWGIHPGPGNVCQGATEQSKPEDRNVAQPQRFVLEVAPPPQLMPDIGLPEFVTAYRELDGETNAQGQYNRPKTSAAQFKLRGGEIGLSVRERESLSTSKPYILPFLFIGESPAREAGKPSYVVGFPNCVAYFRPVQGIPLHWEIECTPSGAAMATLMSVYAKAQKELKTIEPNPKMPPGTVLPL